jgi:hypothetical protein
MPGARALLKTLAPEADALSDGRRIEPGRWQLQWRRCG